ncbi:MAG: high-affinity branched-chain amino acid ABC transporter permease LivM [Rhodospirillales bacterium]|nr:high-affinity branched-chain amino acid ABC transporter permease LivM [Rhodospirillales bacterium]
MLRDAASVAAVSIALAIPLVGFHLIDHLSTTQVEFRFGQLFYAVAVIFLGRLGLLLIGAGWARPIASFTSALSLAWLVNSAASAVPVAYPALGWFTFLLAATLAVRGWHTFYRDTAGAAAKARQAGLGAMVSRAAVHLTPFLVLVAVSVPFYAVMADDKRAVDLGILIFTYIMLGWGLNVVVGLAGLLDLGYVAFYAVGAYCYAIVSIELGLSFWESLPLAGALAATFGVLLGFPVLRLRGDYLAIVTLGFGEIIRIILLNWNELSNGPKGIGNIPRPGFFGIAFTASPPEGSIAFHEYFGLDYSPMHRQIFLYYIILVLAMVTNWFTLRIRKLPIGRAWEALREDETACRALGINPTNTKLTAFAIGAMFGGFAGAFFATRQGFISPESFNFLESAIILAIVVLGGMGSQIGVVIAAIVLIGGPEWFRDLELYRMLAFGALMVAIMIWRPQGLLAHRDPTIRLGVAGRGGTP